MKDIKFWEFVKSNIEDNDSVMMLAVLESTGGSPGKAGFKMAVSTKGELFGTIGGGIMEYNLVEKSKKYLKKKEKVRQFQKLYHNKKVKDNQSGLICAGTESIFMCSLSFEDMRTINRICKVLSEGTISLLKISSEGISIEKDKKNDEHILFNAKSGEDWYYEENIGIQNTVYIIGSGHVGLAVSKIMSQLDFYVVSFDDRPNVPTVKKNNFAHELIIKDFNKIGEDISEGDYSYVVIVTTAYPSDKAALLQIINKEVKYIGLMGSAAKIKKIFDELQEEGISKTKLKSVHAPIGEKISSDTPDEIAISIAAEIIKIKNSVN